MQDLALFPGKTLKLPSLELIGPLFLSKVSQHQTREQPLNYLDARKKKKKKLSSRSNRSLKKFTRKDVAAAVYSLCMYSIVSGADELSFVRVIVSFAFH